MVDQGVRSPDGRGLAPIAGRRELAVELRQALDRAPEETQPYDRHSYDAGPLRSHEENGSGGTSDRCAPGHAVTGAARTSAATGRRPAGGTPRRPRRTPP
jgi:hypothetical protein